MKNILKISLNLSIDRKNLSCKVSFPLRRPEIVILFKVSFPLRRPETFILQCFISSPLTGNSFLARFLLPVSVGRKLQSCRVDRNYLSGQVFVSSPSAGNKLGEGKKTVSINIVQLKNLNIWVYYKIWFLRKYFRIF